MKIIHIYKTFYPDTIGGAEKAIENICKATAMYGCKNELLTVSKDSNSRPTMTFSAVDAYYYQPTIDIASCPMSWKMLRSAKQKIQAADIVHYHFPWPFADFMHLFLNIKKPSVVTYHSDIVRQAILKYPYRPFRNAFLKRVNCIVPTSPNLLQSSPVLQQYQAKCHPIPLTLAEEDYKTADPELIAKIKRQYGNNFFLFVGVLRYYKGLHVLIEAVKDLNIPVVIAGDGPEKQALMALTNKYQLSNIYFLGKVTEQLKIALMHCARAVVLPSHLRSEAFGVSLLEGLLFGKPLISTNLNTGTSYVNQHRVTGIVVEPNNVEQLREAILHLSLNDGLVKQMESQAKRIFHDLFSMPKIGKRYVDIYDKL